MPFGRIKGIDAAEPAAFFKNRKVQTRDEEIDDNTKSVDYVTNSKTFEG